MTTQSIDVNVFSFAHPNITKRTNVSGLISAFLLIAIGVAALITMGQMSDKASSFTYALMTVGVAFIGFGVYRLFSNSKESIYMPTGSVTKEKSLFFDLKHLDDLKQNIFSGEFPADSAIKSEQTGNVRMDVVISRDNQFAAVQLFQFVPYAYQPITSIRYYSADEIESLASFLVQNGVRK